MRIAWLASVWVTLQAQPFLLPTANRALFDGDGGASFFVGTVARPWTSGTFGCVRSGGGQMHEGIDIRCLERDRQGEPTDPVRSTAAGQVVYANAHPGLSNYGRYLVVRHQINGLEVYSLYAHLRDLRPDLRPGSAVAAGERLGTLGRSANTQQSISKERAHLHFELNLLLNDDFVEWHRRHYPDQRNDHGLWNGRNLLGLDPRHILLAQEKAGARFNLAHFIRAQPELCRVRVRAKDFPWVRRYRALLENNPRARQEGVAGYDLSLTFNGVPCRVTPRAASEMTGTQRIALLSVNEAEQKARPCGKLVSEQQGRWRLTRSGELLVDLLLFGAR
jgi:murein DD-endopeptidase MepM/ murein hydrolase activator NlpD